jgi:hypothetical protein
MRAAARAAPSTTGGENSASVQFSLASGTTGAGAAIGADAILGRTLDLPAVAMGKDRYVASTPVMFFIDEGRAPTVFISGGTGIGVNSVLATLVGYLVPI